ncbi:MAG TPA: glycosyltransferase [Firmicutes bacterium]|nr:glycosyltransferase [Candidatus Fermentithermobacillaceae bacterium]
MRVLHVITDTNIGGAGRYLLGMLKTLKERSPEVLEKMVVACPRGMLADELFLTGVPVVYHGGRDVSFSPGLTIEIARLIRRLKPQIVHTHACLSARIASKCLGVPVIYTKHSFDPGGRSRNRSATEEDGVGADRRETLVPPRAAATGAAGLKRRGITGPLGVPRYCRTSLRGWLQCLLNGVVSRCLSDRVIAVSHAVASALQSSGVPSSMIVTIYNGVDPREYGPSDCGNSSTGTQATCGALAGAIRGRGRDERPHTLIIGTVARLHRDKGLDVLVDAAEILTRQLESAPGRSAGLNEVRFVVAGEGPERPVLAEKIRKSGLTGVFQLVGHVKDVPEFLKGLDLFVLPSRREALGLSILEAMASELPVVATNVGGIPEVVVNGETGLLVEPDNPEELCRAIMALLADPELRTVMGKRGKARVQELFDIRRTVEKTLQLYREVLRS